MVYSKQADTLTGSAVIILTDSAHIKLTSDLRWTDEPTYTFIYELEHCNEISFTQGLSRWREGSKFVITFDDILGGWNYELDTRILQID